MKDRLIRIVCGLFGLATAALSLSFARSALRYRDLGYLPESLSFLFALAAFVLLRRALRGAMKPQSGSRA
jgi:hypothetical protein